LPVAVAATAFNVPVARLWTRSSIRFAIVLAAMALVYFAAVNAWLVSGGGSG
jgi:hypothetical protein